MRTTCPKSLEGTADVVAPAIVTSRYTDCLSLEEAGKGAEPGGLRPGTKAALTEQALQVDRTDIRTSRARANSSIQHLLALCMATLTFNPSRAC